MPRSPTYYHPLRSFRSSLALSQPAFGARIGVSGITIQQIENGLLPMSVKLALRICIVFKTRPQEFLSVETRRKFKRQLEPMIEFYHYLDGEALADESGQRLDPVTFQGEEE